MNDIEVLEKIVQEEMARADKYEIAPLQRIMLEIIKLKNKEKENGGLNLKDYETVHQ